MAPVLRHCPCLRPENDDVRLLEYSHSNLDDVPNEVFGYERTLEELFLDANQIKDLPRPLFHCHGLRKLNLSDNEIQTLPPAIASLINLEQLDISKNGVLEIPDSIKGCKCLNAIDASVNPLGKLPEGFTFLLNLQELYLNDTFLEYLPANFGRLVHLKILELRENHLKLLPKSMARLIELNRLDIGQNDFADLPEVIGNLPRLVELWCDSNNLNCLPPFLGGLKKLAYLDASKNKIYEIADEIEGCISLCDLTLSSNRIKVLPEGIANLRRLTVLRVDENRIISIPQNIGNLCNLEELVLSSNNLKSLPPSLGLLRSLRTLIADDNLLEELPSEIGSCLKLTILSLRDNKLVHIPDELGHITALKVINLSGNLLQYLPFSIAKLPNLQALWLSENQNKPLIPLQSDTDRASGIKVLTCFMLPQVPLDEEVIDVPDVEVGVKDPEKGRPIIKFAFDAEKDQPSRLVRAPTPYPKELKAHARHARNFALKKHGSKDSEGNDVANEAAPVVDENEGLHATGATPDIMILPTTVSNESNTPGVKEAVVARPKSPLTSPSKHERHYIPNVKNLSSQEEMKQHSFLEQNPLQVSQVVSSDIASEINAKILGRRDSRGDGSSSENTSTSATGSPKLTPDGGLNETYSHSQKADKDGHFKKNIPTAGKRDTWMRQRLLRQGSGDSDRGYRSDHEVYLAERDQFGQQQCYHDGYASDWEAFLAKQSYEGPSNPDSVHGAQHYNRSSFPPNDVEYRGHAEGQEIKSDVERDGYVYPWNTRFRYPDENPSGLVDEEYQARMTPPYNGYYQIDPVSGQFFPVYDMSHSYPPGTDSSTYIYGRNPGAEAAPPQSYYEDCDGYKHPASHYWMPPPTSNPPPIPATNPGTLPRRLGAASPRLKRAQCLSVQAPLHGTPQEYHLMPHQAVPMHPSMPNSSPRPGRSPSPGIESRGPVPYSPQPYQKFPPHFQPQYPGYPITTQPVNSTHFPPSMSNVHPSQYHAAPVYPTMPTSPRMKLQSHMYQNSAVDDSALVSRPYPMMQHPNLHNSPYYSPNLRDHCGPPEPYSHVFGNTVNPENFERVQDAEYGTMTSPTSLHYRSGSIPAQIQSIENCDVNAVQHLNRSVPSINIIPSTSPPRTSYVMGSDAWKGNSAGVSPTKTSSINASSEGKKENTSPQGFHEPENAANNTSSAAEHSSKPAANDTKIKNSPHSRDENSKKHSENLVEKSDSYVVVSPKPKVATQQVTETNYNTLARNKEEHANPIGGSETSSFRRPGCFQAVPVNIPSVHSMPRKKEFSEADSSQKNVISFPNTREQSESRNDGNTQHTTEPDTTKENSNTLQKLNSTEPPKQTSYVSGIIKNINKSFSEHSKDSPTAPVNYKTNSIKHPGTDGVDKDLKSATKSVTKPGFPVPVSNSNASNSNRQSDCPPILPKKDKNAVTMRNIITNPDCKANPTVPLHNYRTEEARKQVGETEKRNEKNKHSTPQNTHFERKDQSSYSQSKIAIENTKNTKFSQNSPSKHSGNNPVKQNHTSAGKSFGQDSKPDHAESNKTCSSDKRFQKVLPPVDKSFHLKPCTTRKSQSSPSPEPPLTPEHSHNLETENYNEKNNKNTSPALPPRCSSNRLENRTSDPPVVPPKRTTSMNEPGEPINRTNVQEQIHSNRPTIDPSAQPNNENDAVQKKESELSKILVDIVQSKEVNNELNVQVQKGNMPDLISRMIPVEKDTLIILEQPPKVLKSVNSEEDELSKDNFSFNKEKEKDGTPDSPKRQSWFFGSHKNSLVFPVIVSRNPEFGFSIEGGIGSPRNPGKPHDNGIYVAHVIADGPASNLLRPGDKILQVDGKDFTHLDHNKAVAVLQECGATISLMVSRE
ncbi:uncharacterized protein [Parasteatoda tepidariorum]|nr:uncharacterized protein LOC107440676 [Parasteatoda tepidariorum]